MTAPTPARIAIALLGLALAFGVAFAISGAA